MKPLNMGDWIQITQDCGGIAISGYYCYIIDAYVKTNTWVSIKGQWYDSKGEYLETSSYYSVDPNRCIILNEPPYFSSKLTRKKLLEEACKRYPIGTIVTGISMSTRLPSYPDQIISTNDFRISADLKHIDIRDLTGYLYVDGEWAKVTTKEKPSIDELLTEARRKYPTGTRVRCLDGLGEPYETSTTYVGVIRSESDIKKYQDALGVPYISGFLYANGNWAEIISNKEPAPQPSSEFKVGDKVIVKEGAPYPITSVGCIGIVEDVLASEKVAVRGSGPEIQSEEDSSYHSVKITPVKSITAKIYDEEED